MFLALKQSGESRAGLSLTLQRCGRESRSLALQPGGEEAKLRRSGLRPGEMLPTRLGARAAVYGPVELAGEEQVFKVAASRRRAAPGSQQIAQLRRWPGHGAPWFAMRVGATKLGQGQKALRAVRLGAAAMRPNLALNRTNHVVPRLAVISFSASRVTPRFAG
jgi:hypothetical protein